MAQLMLLVFVLSLSAQDVLKIEFGGSHYEYEVGKDSITLFLKVVDSDGNKPKVMPNAGDLMKNMVIKESGREIANDRVLIKSQRGIPEGFTFSVLVDLGIPREGKEQIYKVIKTLVEAAPDSSVYLSFFGDEVSSSQLVTRQNYMDFEQQFQQDAMRNTFYSALLSKLIEIDHPDDSNDAGIPSLSYNYRYNLEISRRANENPNKTVMFVFTDSSVEPQVDNTVGYLEVTDYHRDTRHLAPRIFAFYHLSGNSPNPNVIETLCGITGDAEECRVSVPDDRRGRYVSSDQMDRILEKFSSSLEDAMYDFAFTYKATDGLSYMGKVEYQALWRGEAVGEASYSIGSKEVPWPMVGDTFADSIIKYFIALLVTFFTMAFFFCIMKILIPYVKSKTFSAKYYKKYQPEVGIQKRICHYCKQAILPGQEVVMKCQHIMHVQCWQQNDYRCAEYGQNCKTGIQEHVDWQNLFSWTSIRDCQLTMMGILAGLFSWVVFELTGRGSFTSWSESIVKMFLTEHAEQDVLFGTCIAKVSAFMTIGMLLGFFLSLIFRWNDEYRKKNATVYLKIIGLSLLSAVIGIASMAVGGIILCMLLSSPDTTFIPWYCSLPAYLLFSVCASLSLTIKSSIPVKSAMLGGLCSSVIGFIVLYVSSATSSRYPWMNMLLDFVIYGGGLGASLVTVRMLAEKYFLVIQNGVKAGLRIPIHKWMNATGGGNKVTIGMTGECEIQMNWDKSNKVAKEHSVLFIDHARSVPVIKPLATGVIYNSRAELPVNRISVLTNGDTFKIGDTIFRYEETD